jgi:F0F1-type ATP synthase assembly protein I
MWLIIITGIGPFIDILHTGDMFIIGILLIIASTFIVSQLHITRKLKEKARKENIRLKHRGTDNDNKVT